MQCPIIVLPLATSLLREIQLLRCYFGTLCFIVTILRQLLIFHSAKVYHYDVFVVFYST